MKEIISANPGLVPMHVAIIMDGNGRWATKRGLKRMEGHRKGASAALEVAKHCASVGVKYLTVFAFSLENWNRPASEVSQIMDALREALHKKSKMLFENKVSLKVIGAIERLPRDIQELLSSLCEKTKDFDKLHLTVALSYGARDEIVRATKKIAQKVENGELKIDNINEQVMAECLDTGFMPDPDLFIRTSGEMRTSNFLAWQLTYSELYFTETLWPDFSPAEFDKALLAYAQRERRFGLISEQIRGSL